MPLLLAWLVLTAGLVLILLWRSRREGRRRKR